MSTCQLSGSDKQTSLSLGARRQRLLAALIFSWIITGPELGDGGGGGGGLFRLGFLIPTLTPACRPLQRGGREWGGGLKLLTHSQRAGCCSPLQM